MSDETHPPGREEGWQPLKTGIPFMLHNGPVWYRLGDDGYECGFLPVPEIHGNLYGYVHGGMLAAFADFGLGHACWFANASGGRSPSVWSCDSSPRRRWGAGLAARSR